MKKNYHVAIVFGISILISAIGMVFAMLSAAVSHEAGYLPAYFALIFIGVLGTIIGAALSEMGRRAEDLEKRIAKLEQRPA